MKCTSGLQVRTQSTKIMDWTDYFCAVRPNGRTGPDFGSPSSPDWTMQNTDQKQAFWMMNINFLSINSSSFSGTRLICFLLFCFATCCCHFANADFFQDANAGNKFGNRKKLRTGHSSSQSKVRAAVGTYTQYVLNNRIAFVSSAAK